MEHLVWKYLDWCKSRGGRKFFSTISIGVNVGVFAAIYLPNTHLLHKYQDLVQLYEKKEPAPVPEKIQSLFAEVVDDLQIIDLDKNLLKPFMVSGFDVFHAGIWNMKTGGIIGIPKNFLLEKPADVDLARIGIHNSLISVARLEADSLAESLILSRDAQKFAIAREICTIRDTNSLMNCVTASSFYMGFYFFNQMMKNKFNMYTKPLGWRLLLYSASGLVASALFCAQKDFFSKMVEKSVDKELSKINENYVKGGYEFYSKLLQRNIAQRGLLDKIGEQYFDENGNPAYRFRQKTTPITQRRSFFKVLIGTENQKA